MTGTGEMEGEEKADYAENFDLTNVHTPVNADLLIQYLNASKYNAKEIEFLGDGFKHGFDIGYQGPKQRSSKSSNIPLKVGSPVELWNKLIKEVKAMRVAGPFDTIPFDHFIQSPIGLVPKDGGSQTRLIFHLSFDFGEQADQRSLNYHTLKELCSVCYQDLDCAPALAWKCDT